MESTKLMRWLWGEDQGGRISLYEPQREVVLLSLCLPLTSGKTRRFVGKVSRASRSRGIAPDSIYPKASLKRLHTHTCCQIANYSSRGQAKSVSSCS